MDRVDTVDTIMPLLLKEQFNIIFLLLLCFPVFISSRFMDENYIRIYFMSLIITVLGHAVALQAGRSRVRFQMV
jgi:hypothetical protein